MTAQITTLIDRLDNSEVVRDQIAAILFVEQANQQALATLAGKDPALWKLRVYSERSNPWEEFQDAPDASDTAAETAFDRSPIVNVTFDNSAFDMSTSNVVERQKATGTYNVDCYALGSSADKPGQPGHVAGDEDAARQAQRAARLVRSILMSGTYTYLAMRGVVWRRWTQNVTVFQPQSGGASIEHVIAARVAFQVEFNEFSPQVEGQLLELVSSTVTRAETGQLLFAADYPIPGV